MDKAWNVYLFVESKSDLEDIAKTDLRAMVRERERLIHLFPCTIAPPWLEPLALRLFSSEGEWYVEGPPLEQTCRVIVHELADIYQRTPFKPSHVKRLRGSIVVLIGIGSVGSSLALMFALAGVGCIILADPAILEIANVSRHAGNLLDRGRFKAVILAERIAQIDPSIQVVSYVEDIFDWPDDLLAERLGHASLLIASTDQRPVQLMTNDLACRLKIPAAFVGCYEEARGGEVFCTFPGSIDSACYNCLRGGLQTPAYNREIDYSAADDSDGYLGEPGLYAAVSQIANVAAQVALGMLLRDEPDSSLGQLMTPERQLLLVGTALSDGFYRFRKPFDTYFQPLSGRRKDCHVCGQGTHKYERIHESSR